MTQPVINVVDPDTRAVLLNHDLSDPKLLHTDYGVERCVCRSSRIVRSAPRSVNSGDSCMSCGGLTVRTGTCTTCTACGTTGGCG